MMATTRYQIVHEDVNPIWRKTVILENHKAYPDNFVMGKWFTNRKESSKWAQEQMDFMATRRGLEV